MDHLEYASPYMIYLLCKGSLGGLAFIRGQACSAYPVAPCLPPCFLCSSVAFLLPPFTRHATTRFAQNYTSTQLGLHFLVASLPAAAHAPRLDAWRSKPHDLAADLLSFTIPVLLPCSPRPVLE